MAKMKDVELSTEELLDEINNGGGDPHEGETLRAAQVAYNEVMNAANDIRATLDQRARTHGEYSERAATTQMLKRIMRAAPKWEDLKYHEQETLEMVAHKIGRILCGDPHAHDHWHDIAGYATLSADRNK